MIQVKISIFSNTQIIYKLEQKLNAPYLTISNKSFHFLKYLNTIHFIDILQKISVYNLLFR